MTNFAYTDTEPAANSTPSYSQPIMLTNTQSIEGLIAVDHVGFNANNGGQHKAIEFNQDASYVPTPPVSPPQLFTNSVAGLPQLFFYSGDSTHSANQYVVGTNGSTFLLGGIILKWGQTGTVSSGTVISFASAFPNNCWCVVATNTAVNYGSIRTYAFSNSGFTIQFTNNPGYASYIAIGN